MSRPDTKAIRGALVPRWPKAGEPVSKDAVPFAVGVSTDDVRALCERVEALEAALREINNDPRSTRWSADVAFAALEGKP